MWRDYGARDSMPTWRESRIVDVQDHVHVDEHALAKRSTESSESGFGAEQSRS
jgi:hypothetical protein